MRAFLFVLLCVSSFAQSQHAIPFASQNNTIELAIANTSAVSTSNVVVAVTNAPPWLRITNDKCNIPHIKSGEVSTASFTFSVDKSAPVNKPEQVTFTITNSNGERWIKTLSLQVLPPESFELFQNYPNPFNPSTTIAYQLAAPARVTLRVFDMLGREVVHGADEDQPAGYHETSFDASRLSSGIYIYQLLAIDELGNRYTLRRTMTLVR
jgi:hypothetical protein